MGRFLLFLKHMSLFKTGYVILGLLAVAIVMPSCTNANAGNVKQDLRNWVNNLLTPSKTTLEKAVTGYSIKGSIKNKPKNLVVLFEMQQQQLVVIDSVHTDENGNFELKGNVKEPLICQLQWDQSSVLYMILDNKTNAKLEISGTDGNYSVEGKGIEGITDIKELLDLIVRYDNQFRNMQNEAGTLPNTQEGYARGVQLQSDYNSLMAERNKTLRSFAMSKTKSLVPYFIVTFGVIQDPDIELIKFAMEAGKSYSSNSKYVKDITKRYEFEKILAIGAVAPDFKLPQPNGDSLSLSSLRGKVVLIDFWASWCGPCRRENPFNTKMYKKFNPMGFEIIGVSLDEDPGRWKAAIKSDSLVWRHVSDLKKWNSAPAQLYKVSSIPATYLLDKEGRIVAKGLRGEALQAKVEELLIQP